MEGYISEVRMFAGNFAPRGWAFCQGQILGIAEYTPIFALLGTNFGGNGQTTFGLPDLQGRVPIHPGQGPGLTSHVLGEAGGNEVNYLTASNISNHSHTVTGNAGIVTANGDGQTPISINNYPAGNGESIYTSTLSNTFMAPASLSGLTVGFQNQTGSNPLNNRQPYIAVNFIICIEGIFPSRN